jgi:GT2 family glycosyltransferase
LTLLSDLPSHHLNTYRSLTSGGNQWISELEHPSVLQDSSILVSVLVINYNGQSHLPQLLDSLESQTFRSFELIFIDNASIDGSVALVADFCGDKTIPVQLIKNADNVGFASACNQGIQLARGRWLALLNNDAFPEPTWLEHLVAAAQSDHGWGMVGAKLLFNHEPERINSAGIAIDWAGIAWDWRGGEKDEPLEAEKVEIFGPCGGAALYSLEMLIDVGGFDEDFFAYLEDVDLAWRARLAGWRCILEPKARVYHVHSATLGSGSPYKNYLLGRNKVWLITKNYPAPWLFLLLPVIIGYDLMSVFYNALRTRSLSSLKGRLAAFQQLPHFWRKRRAIQRRWKDAQNWKTPMSPLVLPTSVLKRYRHLP